MIVFGLFYIFWKCLSFGASRMEYRAVGSVGFLIYFTFLILYHGSTIFIGLDKYRMNAIAAGISIGFYFLFLWYLKTNQEYLKELDEIKGIRRAIYFVIALALKIIVLGVFFRVV